ncbi:hypothetical protein IHE45_04G106600 [Dioscorea alata]|uniref:Uncharacterized protein n=1 Tax=Dioscorea alata TaxID=55571 RepID=A0ACB7WF82_DIOAL|nr:hypothetical protein IHE45_04G106600 [Dioscorea alata]
MEDFRSRSFGDGRRHMELYSGGGGGGDGREVMASYPSSGMHDMRCYSASYAYRQQSNNPQKEMKLKKGKSMSASSSSSSYSHSSSSSGPVTKFGWSINDPEMQRKKRVAGYKVYGMEGKMKGSLRKSFRWLKDRYSQVVYGWW